VPVNYGKTLTQPAVLTNNP